mmetsp:Transcript_2203/g.3242  ORF Transcript_2203/g.3242 Transcript_2203/m.3242 type:complete len:569 (+) Transcript_2203:913-2619(+)|eukprot:CAMPEP_0203779660 /NCGR_PEP_ID=MMETSP0099_2-20121227/8838_1 /ASSEMBLY_ACC=CAM_ASM_000209 /TAXON_ID=96639 /ORGANISM=" , Strain NY0313808BC1" /LENGTH=568 /DNA_ID=CAMNT_0050679629 /DNA_START=766 /DNA_END=2472 /DNA_ORIENTATION=-
MYIKDTFVDKAAEGRSKVLEFGVYILETLGSVGIPAEQVTAVLLSFRGNKENRNDNRMDRKKKKTRRRRRKKNRGDLLINTDQVVSSEREGNKNKALFQKALRFVVEAQTSSPQQVISKILFYLADSLGDSLDKPSKREIERAVGAFVEEAHYQRRNRGRIERIPQPMCRNLTGVVLSYRERDDLIISSSARNQIRKGMHFDVPLRPFDATVQLLPVPGMKNSSQYYHQQQLCIMDQRTPPPSPRGAWYFAEEEEEHDKLVQQELEEQDLMGRMMVTRSHVGECVVPCTPQSFPPTPESRTALLDDYSEFTENVLYRARDELRGEQEENDRPRMAIFNPEDCHSKIALSCGGHCAALEIPRENVGRVTRIYRSVRAALAFQGERNTYFEMCPLWCGPDGADVSQCPLQLCVGVSNSSMPLRNTVPGCTPLTIGLDSSGVLLHSGRTTRAPRFTYGSVIGVCVRVSGSHHTIAFYIDGEQVFFDAQELGVELSDQDNVEFKQQVGCLTSRGQALFPTVSIKSRDVKVFGHFSAADMRHQSHEDNYWRQMRRFCPRGGNLFALDGTLILE